MAMYRIIDGGTIYTLDAVTSGNFTFRGQATDKPIQSGATVADHYINLNNGITVSGKISDVKRLVVGASTEALIEQADESEKPKAVLDWITELRALKESGRTFTLEVAPSSGTTFNDCVFEELDFGNDLATGRFYQNNFAFTVTMTIKQIRKSRRATVTTEPEISGTLSDKTLGSGANVVAKQEDRKKALAVDIAALEASIERRGAFLND